MFIFPGDITQLIVALLFTPFLYNPRAFLWTVTQNYARKHFVPLDTLNFSFEAHSPASRALEKEPRDGIFISGFVLEGASWDASTGALEDLAPGDFVSQAPAFHFLPTIKLERDPQSFSCPVYQTSERSGKKPSNFIASIDMKSRHNPLKWTLLGVALILDVDADGSGVGKLNSTNATTTTGGGTTRD